MSSVTTLWYKDKHFLHTLPNFVYKNATKLEIMNYELCTMNIFLYLCTANPMR